MGFVVMSVQQIWTSGKDCHGLLVQPELASSSYVLNNCHRRAKLLLQSLGLPDCLVYHDGKNSEEVFFFNVEHIFKVKPTCFCINTAQFLALCQQNALLNHIFQTKLQISEGKKKSQEYNRHKSNQSCFMFDITKTDASCLEMYTVRLDATLSSLV